MISFHTFRLAVRLETVKCCLFALILTRCAAIHGMPWAQWDNAGYRRGDRWLGYCPHGVSTDSRISMQLQQTGN
jgi:hypothetical protein